MKTTSERFEKVTDNAGETFYCPLEVAGESGRRTDPEACVEATTVERYAGNLNIVD
jgi:hypothetical protein